ncbi:hypothetical protein DEDE109153_05820 [Deinococcus deserti]|uniref:Uncharacterized protein n=1 Tax=Deinococcus deserti (strain DSM 17065 / CIP 109153 / LMG 22923 / VCD115) TaxID=546414 RepID=C1CYS8_DEIDV|nr:hypothetical protein [Deinococcus deserti]ACO47108.1 Hypothetical protein, precursor [Deinococcus deserti VCD115]
MKRIRSVFLLIVLSGMTAAPHAFASSNSSIYNKGEPYSTNGTSDWVVSYYTRATNSFSMYIETTYHDGKSQYPGVCYQWWQNWYQDYITYERVQVWHSGREVVTNTWNQPQGSKYAEYAGQKSYPC